MLHSAPTATALYYNLSLIVLFNGGLQYYTVLYQALMYQENEVE